MVVSGRSYPAKWRRAAFSSDAIAYLTAEETTRLNRDINALVRAYREATTTGTIGRRACYPCTSWPLPIPCRPPRPATDGRRQAAWAWGHARLETRRFATAPCQSGRARPL